MALTKGDLFTLFKMKGTKEKNDEAMKDFNADPPELQKKICDLARPFMTGQCSEMCKFCGGMSGWVLFLIIVLVLGVLAGGAAAFWFYYWKRKYGGKEEEERALKTRIEIPVETY